METIVIVNTAGVALLVLLQYILGRYYGVGPKITIVGMALLVGLVVFLERARIDRNIGVAMRAERAAAVIDNKDDAPEVWILRKIGFSETKQIKADKE